MEEAQLEREVSRAEKILALALAAFLLVGGIRLAWTIDQAFPRPDYQAIYRSFGLEDLQKELDLLRVEEAKLGEVVGRNQEAETRARLDYEVAREEYRTLLDRGVDDPAKRRKWEQARSTLEQAVAAKKAAETKLRIFREELLNPKQEAVDNARAGLSREVERLNRARDIKAGSACLGYALLSFALSLVVFNYFRRSPKVARYSVIGTSVLGFGAVQVLVVSFKTVLPFLRGVVPVEWIISLGGSAISIAGLVYLRNRFLAAPVVRRRRLWKGSCPACGFPRTGTFCPWCGAEQTVSCPHCGEKTSQHLPYCESCGKLKK